MPSFMSISARVQELFRKNRGGGGGGRYAPPRRLRVKEYRILYNVLIQNPEFTYDSIVLLLKKSNNTCNLHYNQYVPPLPGVEQLTQYGSY